MNLYIKGIGMMVGMIFGAGIFVLPFMFSQSGLFWGTVHFLIALFIILVLNFLYAEVAYYTKGKHRFTGYTEIFLGKIAKHFAFLSVLFSYYGSLLIYGLLGGIFLSNFFQNGDSYKTAASAIFFAVGGILAFLNLRKIGVINFYLTVPLFGFVIYLAAIAFPFIRTENFLMNLNFNFNNGWFLPYGIWIFTLSGSAVIPEVRDIFSKSPLKDLKKVILISLILCAFFSLIFGLAVWGASNNETTEDALGGMMRVLGKEAFLIGSLVGLMAVFTSFLALAADMRSIFKYDYNIPRFWAWLLAVIPPLALFFFGATDFVKILGLVGAFGLGVGGVFTIMMARKMRKRIAEGDPGDLLEPDNGEYTKPSRALELIVLIGIIAGAFYEIWRIFS